MNDLQILLSSIAYKVERLESHVRRHEESFMELLEATRVVNRKVELILDQQETDGFLEKEKKEEECRPGPTHQAVYPLSEADAKARTAW